MYRETERERERLLSAQDDGTARPSFEGRRLHGKEDFGAVRMVTLLMSRSSPPLLAQVGLAYLCSFSNGRPPFSPPPSSLSL